MTYKVTYKAISGAMVTDFFNADDVAILELEGNEIIEIIR